jgi:heme-degrading monooxygenase HmoA
MGLSSMVEIVCEFVVKQEKRGQFELAYGPGGAWSKLFARSPGFRGTTVLRDTKDPRRYLTFELWDSVAQRGQALAEGEAEYSSLEAALAGWAETRIDVGIFSVLAEATVRPSSRAGRAAFEGKRQRSRRTTR